MDSRIDKLELISRSIIEGVEEYLDERREVDNGLISERIEGIRDMVDIESFKGVILNEIAYILKYGSSNEKIRIISELLKYLYPTKREVDMRVKGNITLAINPKIAGEEVEIKEESDGNRD